MLQIRFGEGWTQEPKKAFSGLFFYMFDEIQRAAQRFGLPAVEFAGGCDARTGRDWLAQTRRQLSHTCFAVGVGDLPGGMSSRIPPKDGAR